MVVKCIMVKHIQRIVNQIVGELHNCACNSYCVTATAGGQCKHFHYEMLKYSIT